LKKQEKEHKCFTWQEIFEALNTQMSVDMFNEIEQCSSGTCREAYDSARESKIGRMWVEGEHGLIPRQLKD